MISLNYLNRKYFLTKFTNKILQILNEKIGTPGKCIA